MAAAAAPVLLSPPAVWLWLWLFCCCFRATCCRSAATRAASRSSLSFAANRSAAALVAAASASALAARTVDMPTNAVAMETPCEAAGCRSALRAAPRSIGVAAMTASDVLGPEASPSTRVSATALDDATVGSTPRFRVARGFCHHRRTSFGGNGRSNKAVTPSVGCRSGGNAAAAAARTSRTPLNDTAGDTWKSVLWAAKRWSLAAGCGMRWCACADGTYGADGFGCGTRLDSGDGAVRCRA